MISVVSETKPAEFVATLATCHVHAALVLLDVGFALRTGLGVQFDPRRGVVLAEVDSVQPLLQELTVDGLVRAFLAKEAKVGLTLIAVNVFQRVVREFEAEFVTIGTWTVFAILSNVDKGLALEVLVPLKKLIWQQLNKKGVRYYEVAFGVRTNCENAICAISDSGH